MRGRTAIALAAVMLSSGSALAADPVVPYTITDGSAIEESLTGEPGDPEQGRALFTASSPADCASCHGLPGSAQDRTGPDLAAVGGRLTPGEIRLWIVAPEVRVPGTAMPSYYAAGQRRDPDDPLYGGPALTAAQVEDLVAYLAAGP